MSHAYCSARIRPPDIDPSNLRDQKILIAAARHSHHDPEAMSSTSIAPDLELLRQLNDDYIAAVLARDARRFDELLADDFLCTLPDGSLIDRAAFLAELSQPRPDDGLTIEDVRIRLMGDVAIVHARTTFTRPNGTPGAGRYTDVWARRHGRWQAVAAQFTRG